MSERTSVLSGLMFLVTAAPGAFVSYLYKSVETGAASPMGTLWNEVPDRFSDEATL